MEDPSQEDDLSLSSLTSNILKTTLDSRKADHLMSPEKFKDRFNQRAELKTHMVQE